MGVRRPRWLAIAGSVFAVIGVIALAWPSGPRATASGTSGLDPTIAITYQGTYAINYTATVAGQPSGAYSLQWSWVYRGTLSRLNTSTSGWTLTASGTSTETYPAPHANMSCASTLTARTAPALFPSAVDDPGRDGVNFQSIVPDSPAFIQATAKGSLASCGVYPTDDGVPSLPAPLYAKYAPELSVWTFKTEALQTVDLSFTPVSLTGSVSVAKISLASSAAFQSDPCAIAPAAAVVTRTSARNATDACRLAVSAVALNGRPGTPRSAQRAGGSPDGGHPGVLQAGGPALQRGAAGDLAGLLADLPGWDDGDQLAGRGHRWLAPAYQSSPHRDRRRAGRPATSATGGDRHDPPRRRWRAAARSGLRTAGTTGR